MPLHEESSVRIDGCTVVWDGVKSPETVNPTDGSAAFNKYTLKVVVPGNSPDLAILDNLGKVSLQESVFKGVFPAGGHWLLKPVAPGEFGDLFPGWYVVNGITFNPPQVFDEQGNVLHPTQYGPALYAGQRVNMLVSAKAYNEKSKGVKAQLEGFQIVASAQAQPIAIGGGSNVNAGSAFGGGQAAPQQPQQPQHQPGGHQQPQQPQHQPGGYQQPQQPGVQGGPPSFGGAPNAEAPSNPPANANTAYAPSATASPSNPGGYPAQSTNFLPPQG